MLNKLIVLIDALISLARPLKHQVPKLLPENIGE